MTNLAFGIFMKFDYHSSNFYYFSFCLFTSSFCFFFLLCYFSPLAQDNATSLSASIKSPVSLEFAFFSSPYSACNVYFCTLNTAILVSTVPTIFFYLHREMNFFTISKRSLACNLIFCAYLMLHFLQMIFPHKMMPILFDFK